MFAHLGGVRPAQRAVERRARRRAPAAARGAAPGSARAARTVIARHGADTTPGRRTFRRVDVARPCAIPSLHRRVARAEREHCRRMSRRAPAAALRAQRRRRRRCVLDRGEGAVRLRRRRPPLRRRALEPVLRAARLLVRRAARRGRGARRWSSSRSRRTGASRSPPAIELAERLGELHRPAARVLHERRVGVGRGGVEDRAPRPPRARRARSAQGDRAAHRLPRRDARGARADRRRADEGAVRAARDRGPPRRDHERLPARGRRPARRRRARGRGGGAGDGRDDHRRAGAERRRLPHAARRATGQGLREIADRCGALLVADEVITGFGRLGEWLGSQRYGAAPDLVTCAKGLTAAYVPMGAVLVRDEVAAPLYDAGPHAAARRDVRRPPGLRGGRARGARHLRAGCGLRDRLIRPYLRWYRFPSPAPAP